MSITPAESASKSIDAITARRLSLALPVFLGTIFLSAFLLFGIQPLFTKMVLPRLGGSPGVWSVAMVFFQAMLLAGYAYAHVLVSRLGIRRAALTHIVLMAAVLAVALPIRIAAGFNQPPEQGEALWLVMLFGASVGLPFFAVAANGPLLQAWFARSGHPHARDPYFLYAASNFGSFLALLAYPLVIEPVLPLSLQSSFWSWGFALLLAGIAGCAAVAIGERPAGASTIAAERAEPASGQQRLGWVALSFVPSALLVAVTAHISTDVAAAPFLWVVPLALFLLTFVIVFQPKPWLRHSWMLNAHLVLMATYAAISLAKIGLDWEWTLPLHLTLFFVAAMVAHGELVKRKPDASQLTEFYLFMSLGGVLGGLFAGLLAPVMFATVREYPLLLAASLFCRPGLINDAWPASRKWLLATAAILGLAVLVVQDAGRTDSVRSFFGVHKLTETSDGRHRLLYHGTTLHGAERIRTPEGITESGRPEPLTYYYFGGAIHQAVDAAREAQGGRLGRVAAIGAGTGSLACHIERGEDWSFYEIDAAVTRIARDPSQFRFLSVCAPGVPVINGDARLTLANAADGSLDLIIVDAFSSDAIPVHLLTSEAMALYQTKLTPHGVVALHISNRNMELGSVVSQTAALHGFSTWIKDGGHGQTQELASAMKIAPHVAVIARKAADVGPLASIDGWKAAPATGKVKPWTDDYADIPGAIWRKLVR